MPRGSGHGQHLHLSRRERQIMDVLYAAGEASAADVRERLPHPPSYSAVRALLGKLVEKGHVTFRQDGPRYLYRATLEKSAAEQSAWQRLLDTFFSGSAVDAVVSLLGREGEHLSAEELEAIERKLAELKARQPRGRGPRR
ncbi:MAG TPA: BlaI/MecI/CopY family transcriptional regulator [Pseudomonadales bacterium]